MSDKLIEENDCGRNLFYEPQNANEKKIRQAAIFDNEYFCPVCGCVPDENGKCHCSFTNTKGE